jgi:nucleotide-binding universal stress UspA family protein
MEVLIRMQLLENPSRVRLDKILLLTEFPPWADVAVPYALGLAREHRARMHVAHPVPAHAVQKLTHIPQGGAFRRSWSDLVFETATRQVVVDSDTVAARLRQMAERHDFDLIVVSFGRAEGTSKRAIGNTLEHAFKGADCPVLVIGPAVDSETPPRTEPATILHATDFSPHALAAAQHAFSWAQEYQSWLTLLHVVNGIGVWTEHERERVEAPFCAWMQELVPAELPLWCEVEHRVEFGDPGDRIVHAAEELHADLVVIGLTGMDAVTQDSPGATTLEVITRAPCPVIVVREYMKKMAARPVARDRRERLAATVA